MSTLSTTGAGSPLMQKLEQETSNKRHSRSLDLQPSARTRHLHHRSASESDGLELIIAAENDVVEPIPTTKSNIPSSNSVFSLYKKFGSPGRQRSISNKSVLPEINTSKRSQFQRSRASIGSAFAGLRQPSISTNALKNRFSTPINNPGI